MGHVDGELYTEPTKVEIQKAIVEYNEDFGDFNIDDDDEIDELQMIYFPNITVERLREIFKS